MAKNRLEYALILLCTALFHICFVGYLSFYVFMLTLILPLFSPVSYTHLDVYKRQGFVHFPKLFWEMNSLFYCFSGILFHL